MGLKIRAGRVGAEGVQGRGVRSERPRLLHVGFIVKHPPPAIPKQEGQESSGHSLKCPAIRDSPCLCHRFCPWSNWSQTEVLKGCIWVGYAADPPGAMNASGIAARILFWRQWLVER